MKSFKGKSSKQYLSCIMKAGTKASQPLIVALFNRRGSFVASGAVFTKGEHAYLFSGGVIPRYQGKGYWHELLAARQIVSGGLGAKHWVFNTSNERIKKHFDKRLFNHYSVLSNETI